MLTFARCFERFACVLVSFLMYHGYPVHIYPLLTAHDHSFTFSPRSKPNLLPKQPPHPFQHTILLRIVWMILTRYLEQTRKRSGVALDAMPYLLGNVLVDEQDGDVLALGGERVEGGFDGGV